MRPLRGIGVVWILVLAAGCQTSDIAKTPGIKKLGEMTGLTASDEEQIVAVLDDVQRGMQSRSIFKVLAHVSRSYHDEEGRDYAALEAYLNSIFKNYRELQIRRVPPRISVEGDQARAVETFGTMAEPQNPKLEPPVNLQGQVSVFLAKVGGQWQIVEWGRIL